MSLLPLLGQRIIGVCILECVREDDSEVKRSDRMPENYSMI